MMKTRPTQLGGFRAKRAMITAFLLLLLSLPQLVQAQDPPQYGTPFNGVPNRMDANIYQMNLREYSSSRNIAGARAKLQRVKDLGINVIYLMPIFPVSTASQASGSPYSNTDYKAVAPDLGTLNDLRGLVQDAHNLGMAVILDFIVNQTGFDHPWINQHPEYYFQDGNGNIQQAGPFPDVAGIDLNNTGAANAMIDAMRYWVFAANVDGFRFDWADQPPQAFWNTAISNLRSISTHDLLLLAEGSNEGTQSGCQTCGNNQPGAHYAQGFDYIFGTNFYWNVMKKVWDSGEPVTNLDGVTAGEYNGASSTQLVTRFLSNHDDYNAEGSPFSFLQGGRAGVMAAFVLATYHRSVPFIYNGIEVGNTNPLPYPWNSGNINWSQDLTVYTEMQKILNARNGSVALRRGQPTSYIDPANTNPDVFAFTKESGGEKVAVLINPRGGNRSFTIPSGMAGTYTDIFNPGNSVTWTAGQNVTLNAYQYIVLSNGNVPQVDVTGVGVNPTSSSIIAGLTQQLSASVQPSNATNQSMNWSSSNTSVATVTASGLVTAISAGTATITATTVDGGYQASANITVNPAPTFTVHFYKPAAWGTNINIYWWDAQPTGLLADGSWPGVAMTNEGGGWYSYTFSNITSTNLIFNDGSSQTDNLSRNGTDGWYQNGIWYNSNPGGCSPSAITPYVNVNGGGWNQSSTATLDAGGSLTFGPQPTGGSWSWSGPNGYSASSREITLSNMQPSQSGTYTASYTNSCGAVTTQNFSVTVNSLGQTPYNGVISLPGTVEVENFDNGADGESYHDNDASNQGGQYRTTGVDIEACSEGGYSVGWTNGGEWLEYTVNVAASGNYDIGVRVAGAVGGTLRVEFDGVNKTGPINAPNTGGWQSWQTVTVTNVSLKAGQQIMRIYMISGSFNLNNVSITASSTGGGGSGSQFYIKNRWQGTYLYDAGTNVSYGSFSSASNYKWELVTVGSYQAIRNVATGDYMNIESLNGTVQSTNIGTGAWSAQWAIEDYDGHKRIRNRWQSGDYVHVENLTGNAQHGAINAGWHSNHWSFESASGSRVDIGLETVMNKSEVTVYPNPVIESVQINMTGLFANELVNLDVVDMSGRKIHSMSFSTSSDGNLKEQLDLSSLKTGIYHLQITSDGEKITKKIIKR
ncbi:alpha-amylase family glycosyl hydrolase [Marinoscillum pacificum]|uniref:alpha-amylase family glycosyl hydrolase n=1 Tax=Marinoscillum pacificum TaxID=392723 RepID=UPI00215889A8|nr:alpha-amylase family glycosyl hydrolase [Marinoscillum pacificum]